MNTRLDANKGFLRDLQEGVADLLKWSVTNCKDENGEQRSLLTEWRAWCSLDIDQHMQSHLGVDTCVSRLGLLM